MTDLQDLILDRLVGAKLGANLPDSPLRVAAELMEGGPIPDEEFAGAGISEAGISVVARRLGYPVQLCQAFQGVIGGLHDEEDRRRFAITFFRFIPCGGSQPRVSRLDQARLAASVAVRVHPLVCHDATCEVPAMLTDLELSEPFSAQQYVMKELGIRCPTVQRLHPNGVPRRFLDAHSSLAERLDSITAFTLHGFANKRKNGAWWAVRLATQLVVAVKGSSEALGICVHIARRCGMATESV